MVYRFKVGIKQDGKWCYITFKTLDKVLEFIQENVTNFEKISVGVSPYEI